MSPVSVGIVGIGVLILMFLLRMPISFAMALVGFAGFAYLSDSTAAFGTLARSLFVQFTSYPLSALPMFILMGSFAFAAGTGGRLYAATYAWAGHIRGGLTVATTFACAAFGAICGSSTATAATIGRIALPEMKKYHYDDSLATGTLAAGGTLGILIPPSTVLLVYGYLLEESVGRLFIAGILPGILLALLFALAIYIVCLRNPALGPAGAPTTWGQKLRASTGFIEVGVLFFLIIFGLLRGWFSPTQAGAVGAAGALIVGLVRRGLTWQKFIDATKDGLRTSCMVMWIVTTAVVFGRFMALSRIPFELAAWVGQLPLPAAGIVGVIVFIFFIGGFFMDAMALMVLLIPIIYPVLALFEINLIWFGVVTVLVVQMGVITPPVGVNVFVIKGIAPEVPVESIFRGIWPFLVAMIIGTIIVIAFPQIATFLPGLVGR